MKNLLMIRILTAQSNFPKMKEHMQMMMQDANQSKDVQAISVLVQYLAQRVSIALTPILSSIEN